MSPAARAFLDDLVALCKRHQVRLDLDWMYEDVNLRRLTPGEDPIAAYFFADHLEDEPDAAIPFPQAGADWGTVTHWGIVESPDEESMTP